MSSLISTGPDLCSGFGTRSKSFDNYVLLSCFLQSRAAKDEMFCLLLLLHTVHKSCQPRIG